MEMIPSIENIKTICYGCKHFKNLDPDGITADLWYSHLCTATPLPQARDPVTGKILSVEQGSSIPNYINRRWVYCREINDGNCAKYCEIKKPHAAPGQEILAPAALERGAQ